jgi:non-specific serine/threonine protein kinase
LIWHVPSLSLPEVKNVLTLEQLSQYEAVQLFIERALLIQPHFQITNANAPALAQLCFRLDGIPLAIELAAARVKGLSVEQIASRLDDRFRLLTGGSRTALPRQRTLQAAIDWSYRLLSEEERLLLRRLAVFAGGWTLEAAEQVCASDELNSDQILDVLLTLVDKCLVVPKTEGVDPHYFMLETIRQYAQEKLDDAGEANLARDHHLAYFQGLAVEAKPHLVSSQQSVWLKRLEIEHDNIRAALAWAQDSGAVEAGLQLMTDLLMFWFYRANFREPSLVLKNLLTKTSADDQIQIIARAHNTLGWLELLLGNLTVAYAHAQESEQLFLQLGQAGKADLAFNQNLLVNIASQFENDPVRMRQDFEANLKLLEEAGDPWWIAHVITSISHQFRRSGDWINARRTREQALLLFQKCGDNIRVSQQNAALALYAFEETDYAEARARFEEVLSFYRQAHVNLVVDVPLWMLGVIAIREKDYALAKKWYSECLLFDLKIGSPSEQLPECLIGFAGIAHSEERFERAAQLLGAADSAVEARQNSQLESFDQDEHQRLKMVVHEELGDAKFEEFVAKGRAMNMEQAIAFALEQGNE